MIVKETRGLKKMISKKPIYRYQVNGDWNITRQYDDEGKYEDTLEGAIERAKDLARDDGHDFYISKVIRKVYPEKKDIVINVEEI